MENKNNLINGFFNWLLRRKILVSVINLFLVITGVLCFFWIEWKKEPESSKTTITVSTQSKFGTHIDVFENEVTKKIEDSVGKVNGVDYFASTTKDGKSDISIHFKENTIPSEALNRVRAAVSETAKNLPSSVDYPEIISGDTKEGSILDILFYNADISNNKDQINSLQKYVEEDIKHKISNMDGVASVMIYGTGEMEIYVALDLYKINQLGLNLAEIKHVLSNAINFTQNDMVGSIILGTKKYSITSMTTNHSIEDLENIQIMSGLKLKDIAKIKRKKKNPTIFFNGSNPAIHMVIYKSSSGNPLDTVQSVKKKIKEMLSTRKDIKVSFVNRLSNTKQLFKKVKSTGLEALILVLIIVLLFTFSLSASFVPAIAVPMSIISTFIVMKALKLSFNPATLGAMVLSIGLVVDDAIVILENIHKKIKEGMEPLGAAISGTAELCLPIILMTLTLAFVFLPTLFSEGPTKYEMKEFAVVIASSVLFSGLNSLTLSPVLSYLLMGKHKENRTHQRFMSGLDNLYRKLLVWCLRFRNLIFAAVLGALTVAIIISTRIQSENKPYIPNNYSSISGRIVRQENAVQNQFFDVAIAKASSILEKYRNKYYGFFYTYVEAGRLNITMRLNNNLLNRKKEILDEIIGELSDYIPELQFSISSDNLEKSVSFSVTGQKEYPVLQSIGDKITNALKDKKLINSVWFSMQKADAYNFSLDFNQIQNYNLEPEKVKEMLNLLFHFTTVGKTSFAKQPNTYKTWIGSMKKYKYSPDQILDMSFPFKDKTNQRKVTYIKLRELVKINYQTSLTSRSRFSGRPGVSFTCGIAPQSTIGTAVREIERLQSTYAPAGIRIEFSGEARDYLSAKGNMTKMLVFAILCIFLILAAQFESLLSAFIVLLTAPLAFIGATLSMGLFGLTFNVYTIIGLITLTGLITKHGILFVSTANNMLNSGLPLSKIIVDAAVLRLNAVLMTTLAMIFGSIPLAISKNSAMIALKQMCIVIIGGISIGSVLTLFFIPLVYYFLQRRIIVQSSNKPPAAVE